MTRYVQIQFEIDDEDGSTDEEVEAQVETLITNVTDFPSSWTWEPLAYHVTRK